MAEDQQSALVVTHSFGEPLPAEICVPLPGKGWRVERQFPHSQDAPSIIEGNLHCKHAAEWQASVVYLKRYSL